MDCFPLPEGSFYESSGYRTPQRPNHNGVDFAAPEETPLFACIAGTITVPAYEPGGAGNNIWINADGIWWKYFHMSHISVVTGQHVDAGELVGAVGHTGAVVPPGPDGAHLHIERHDGFPSNPTDPTEECLRAIKADRYPTSHIPQTAEEDMPLNDDDKQWIQNTIGQVVDEKLQAHGAGELSAEVNMAAVVHHDLNNVCKLAGFGELPAFTVNIDDPSAQVQAKAPATSTLPPPPSPAIGTESSTTEAH